MGEFPRKADGRRIFSAQFKREVVLQLLKGEKTIAGLSREFDVSPTIVRNWKRRYESGAATAVKPNEDVVPASELQAAQAKIRELERALGRKTMEVEILRAAQEVLKKSLVAQRVRSLTGLPVAAICRTLQMARRTAYHVPRARPDGVYRKTDDETVLRQIRSVTNSRASYGTPRTRVME